MCDVRGVQFPIWGKLGEDDMASAVWSRDLESMEERLGEGCGGWVVGGESSGIDEENLS